MDVDDEPALPLPSMDMDPEPIAPPEPPVTMLRRAYVEDVEDEYDKELRMKAMWERYVRKFLHRKEAGKSYGRSQTRFESIQQEQDRSGQSMFGEFEDQGKWELAEWLLSSVGQKKTDEFLKLPIVRNSTAPLGTCEKRVLTSI
jgi:hypothetical protein